MKNLILKRQLWVVMFMLFGCLSIQAADDDLITEQITIKLEKAGTLPDKISDNEKYKITNLKIIGDINGTDLRLIRDMAGCDSVENFTTGKLAILDLEEAKIVSGGEYFCFYNEKRKLYTKDNSIDSAFYRCRSLTSINIPSSVTAIGRNAFRSCGSLTSINIPSSVTSIGGRAFEGCSRLTSINIPSSITSIKEWTFNNCRSLTSINIPSSVTSIDSAAFNSCRSLTSINIPSSVTSIGGRAFEGCSGLTSISIPSSVTSMGKYVFSDCI